MFMVVASPPVMRVPNRFLGIRVSVIWSSRFGILKQKLHGKIQEWAYARELEYNK